MRTRSFTSFGVGMPSPSYTPGIQGRLIPQEGITSDRDAEWGTDTLTQPYLVARPLLEFLILPNQFDSHPAIPTMQFWEPRIRHGKVMAEVTLVWRGIMDGVPPPINANLGLAPSDSTQLQTLQISDPTSGAVADVAFYCPNTVWRWVTLGYPTELPAAYASINDPYNYREPVPIRYVVRTDPAGAPSDLTGIYRTDQTSFRTERWGPYWRNEIALSKRYVNPFTA